MTDPRNQIQQLKEKLADLSEDLASLEKLLGVDVPSSLNKIRFITEKVLHIMCVRRGVKWGEAEPTLERMIGPLTSEGVIPRNIATLVRTIQTNTSPGSHYQEHALSQTHVTIAQTALIEYLEWYFSAFESRPAPSAGAEHRELVLDASNRKRAVPASTAFLIAAAGLTAASVIVLGLVGILRSPTLESGQRPTSENSQGPTLESDKRPTPDNRQPPSAPPNPTGVLSLSLDGMDLSQACVGLLGRESKDKVGREFKDKDPRKLIVQAAEWVKNELERAFPRVKPNIGVTASLSPAKVRSERTFRVDPSDPLHRDHFWMFAVQGKDHPLLSEGEASQEAINKALAASSRRGDIQTNLLVFVDRPGYSLELLKVPIGGGSDRKVLERLDKHAFAVAVDPITGNNTMAEQLVAKLREFGLIAMDIKTRENFKKLCDQPNLNDKDRLDLHRKYRITALVRGTYKQQ